MHLSPHDHMEIAKCIVALMKEPLREAVAELKEKPSDKPVLVTTGQYATMLNERDGGSHWNESIVREWCRMGKFKAEKTGKKWMVYVDQKSLKQPK